MKIIKQITKITALILACLVFLTSSINAQHITRGAVEDEIYISSYTYWDGSFFRRGILHSTNNGENLSVQYDNLYEPPDGEMRVGKIVADATQGVLYNFNGDDFWTSTDTGSNWEYREINNFYTKYLAGENSGVIYKSHLGILYKSIDFATTFDTVAAPPSFGIADIGHTDGEFYGINGNAGEAFYIYYTNDYANTYTEIPLDSTVAFFSLSVCRGAEPIAVRLSVNAHIINILQ